MKHLAMIIGLAALLGCCGCRWEPIMNMNSFDRMLKKTGKDLAPVAQAAAKSAEALTWPLESAEKVSPPLENGADPTTSKQDATETSSAPAR